MKILSWPLLLLSLITSCTRTHDDEPSNTLDVSVSTCYHGFALVSFPVSNGQSMSYSFLSPDNNGGLTEPELLFFDENDSSFIGLFAGLQPSRTYNLNVSLSQNDAVVAYATHKVSLPAVPSAPKAVKSPNAVDLGLSVKWADVNLGAAEPSEAGLRYAWGEISSRSNFTEGNYSLASFHPYLSNIFFSGVTFSGNNLWDAASASLADGWRTPTYAEMRELSRDCSWVATQSASGVPGMLVTGPNGNSIFLPAVGKLVGEDVFMQVDYGLDDLEATGFYLTSSPGSQLYFQVHQAVAGARSGSRSVSNGKVNIWYGASLRAVHD